MNTTVTENEDVGDWTFLGRELSRRTRQPWKHVPLVLYVLVAIVVFGGLGIWVEIVKLGLLNKPLSTGGLFTAMATFYPALVGASALQLLLVSMGHSDRIMGFFAVSVWVMSFVIGLLTAVFFPAYPATCFILVVCLVIFSIWLWMITNVDDPIYKSIPVDSASGGSTSRPLKGDISKFDTD